MNMGSGACRGTVMVVDDSPENLRLMRDMLGSAGFRPLVFPGGAAALAAAARNPPDLILLDIMMPGMDGFETCARLKADDALREIPVLFLSALDRLEDKVRAFEVGCADYITKPFEFREVASRVRAHVELHRGKRALVEHANRLEELEKLRDGYVHMLVHDMCTPLMGITGYLELIEMSVAAGSARETAEMVRKAATAAERLVSMIDDVLDLHRGEHGVLKPRRARFDPASAVRKLLEQLDPLRGDRIFAFDPSNAPGEIFADPDLFTRVIQNLVGNALKFTPAGGGIRIRMVAEGDGVLVEVDDDGPGVPTDAREMIFDKFGQVAGRRENARRSAGLGLAFCRAAVAAHGGRIGVEDGLRGGGRFWFAIP